MPNSKVKAPWVIIPVRSFVEPNTPIARKNLRVLGSKSLLTRAVETAKAALSTYQVPSNILVVVEDASTAEAASRLEVLTVQVNTVTADAAALVSSLHEHLTTLGVDGATSIVVLDPALPLVSPIRIAEAGRAMQENFESVSLIFDEQPVLGFTASNLRNFAAPQAASRAPHLTIEVTAAESTYVETQKDWAVADFFVNRLRVLIRTDVSEVLDPSHAARAIALCDSLSKHQVSLVLTANQTLNEQYFRGIGIDIIEIDDDIELLAVARKENADLVVLDKHLNSAEFVTLLSGFSKVATIEDFGSGAEHADLALNAMFESTHIDGEHQLTGADVQLVPIDFESAPFANRFSAVVKEVVVAFSGQDMYGLTHKVLRALDSLEFDLQVTVIRGLGSDLIDPSAYGLKLKVLSNVKSYAPILKNADLAITSSDFALPLMTAAGVPTLALAQNATEILNLQARLDSGVLSLGFGSLLSEDTLAAHLDRLIEDSELRLAMHERAMASVGVRTNNKVAQRLLRRIGF